MKYPAGTMNNRLTLSLALAGALSLSGASVAANTEQDYREAIHAAEAQHGAYAPALAEHLLGLGRDLQTQNKHREALALLQRGTHLARINTGLHSAEQLPLLEAEINSLLRLGEARTADKRQSYRFRVQRHNLNSPQQHYASLLEEANWHVRAYQLGLGRGDMARLLYSWQLYENAHRVIAGAEGQDSPKLEQPWLGVLRVQHYIDDYEIVLPAPAPGDPSNSTNNIKYDRLKSYKRQSYKRSREAISAIYRLRQAQPDFNPVKHAQTLTMMGDLHLHYGYRAQAVNAYNTAIAELQKLDDAQYQIERLFGEPVPLPAIPGLNALPPEVAAGVGNIEVAFDLTPSGQVVNLRRLNDNTGSSRQAKRLMRQLKRTAFRPRFADGVPTVSKNINKTYAIN